MHPWNEPIFQSVRRMLEGGRLPHALLLHGPRGVGKLALAERLGQLLLCEDKNPAARPCGKCDGCRWYLAGTHPDLRRVEPEALAKAVEAEQGEETEEGAEPSSSKKKKPSLDIKIEQVRALAGFLNLRSHRGALRVALVHPAEEMNANSQNALLKGLEEPPAGAIFILVSHRPYRLLPTVRSRCVKIPVPIPPAKDALAWLKSQPGGQDAARWLAFSGGAPIQALGYAEEAALWDRIIKSPAPVDQRDRESLERLADAVQKIAYDRAFRSFGLEGKYATPGSKGVTNAKKLVTRARKTGDYRGLVRHAGLDSRLLSTAMLAEILDLT
jgi:DNA polymerase-3 subunit delta'